MKTPNPFVLSMAFMLVCHARGGDTNTNVDNTIPSASFTSRFVMPTSPKEGRDPFFPESTRVFDAMMAANQAKQATPTVEITDLKVPGISGTPGHLLAIINNHTFAVGDVGDVLTPSGKVHLRCVAINSGQVTVEVNGHFHQLKVEQQ